MKGNIQVLLLMVTILAGIDASAETRTPVKAVEEIVSAVRRLNVAQAGGVLNTIEKKENSTLTHTLHQRLNIDGLSQSVAKGPYKSLSKRQVKRLTRLLRRVFAEIAYPSAAKFFGALKLSYKDQGESKQSHLVLVTIEHPDEGIIELEFMLRMYSSNWLVEDLRLDGVSLRQDMESQMRVALKKGGFEELVRRLERRLE